jgi:hypothetical protein
MRAQTHRIAIAVCAILLSMAGCAVTTGQPSATPADILGIAADLGEQGITASGFVSGDAGCADRDLTQLAVSMDVSGLDQVEPTRIHLYLFRDQEAYDRLRPAIDACLSAFVTDPAALGLIETPPYVAAGAGPWAPGFSTALRTALTKASGG